MYLVYAVYLNVSKSGYNVASLKGIVYCVRVTRKQLLINGFNVNLALCNWNNYLQRFY